MRSGATEGSSIRRTNAARSLICIAEHSAMFTPSIREDSAARVRRAPSHSGQVPKPTARSTKALMWAWRDSRSLARKSRWTLGTRPS